MADSKYEIRSEEVQKMMNKPVNKRLLWGSTFVLLVLLTGVVFFNRVVITEYRKGTVFIKDTTLSGVITATVENTDTTSSLGKTIYLYIQNRQLQGTIEKIIPLNPMNSNWLIRIGTPVDSISYPRLSSYRLVHRKKTLFTFIKRHFGLD